MLALILSLGLLAQPSAEEGFGGGDDQAIFGSETSELSVAEREKAAMR